MSNDPFASASSGDRITDLDGDLLLITPIEYVEKVDTTFGETDAVDADVVAFDGDTGTQTFDGMRIFQGALIGATKRAAKFNQDNPGGDPKTGRPKMILGRLGRGDAKKGQSAPWILSPPSEADKQLARDYLAKVPTEPVNPFEM